MRAGARCTAQGCNVQCKPTRATCPTSAIDLTDLFGPLDPPDLIDPIDAAYVPGSLEAGIPSASAISRSRAWILRALAGPVRIRSFCADDNCSSSGFA